MSVTIDPDTPTTAPSTDAANSERQQLKDLVGRASALYGRKNYDEAADLYADACQAQEKLNGELAPENADLLYAYGRCLYHVAVSKSDVLGSKGLADGPGHQTESKKRKSREDERESSSAIKKARLERGGNVEINGDDEEWESSDSDDAGEETAEAEAGGEMAEEEQEDDFATAWDILDMARLILVKRVEGHETASRESQGKDKGKGKGVAALSESERGDKDMLADTLDLQAEIALENENFVDAVDKAREALALQTQLCEEDSNRVAEAHFKLALALEFASSAVTTAGDGQSAAESDVNTDAKSGNNKALRDEAIEQMQLSIASTKLRLHREEAALAGMPAGEEATAKQEDVKDVKEIIVEMEQKLSELRAPPVTLAAATAADLELNYPKSDIRAMIGSLIGDAGSADGQAKLSEATRTANDLTSMVRKKGPKPGSSGNPSK